MPQLEGGMYSFLFKYLTHTNPFYPTTDPTRLTSPVNILLITPQENAHYSCLPSKIESGRAK